MAFTTANHLLSGGRFRLTRLRRYYSYYTGGGGARYSPYDLSQATIGDLKISKEELTYFLTGSIEAVLYETTTSVKSGEFHSRDISHSADLEFHGSRYETPRRETPLLTDDTNDNVTVRAILTFVDAELTTSFSLAATEGRVRVSGVTLPLETIRFHRAGDTTAGLLPGTFQGTLKLPGEERSRFFSGVILQNENIGVGCISGTPGAKRQRGRIRLEPGPPAPAAFSE
jgi:hypothetical protein